MKRKGYMMGNKVERKPMMKGRMAYRYGGDVKMDGCQPVYNGTPKAKAKGKATIPAVIPPKASPLNYPSHSS